jgi:transposase-like protein
MRKLKKCGFVLDRLITDDLRSYGAAAHDLGIGTHHERGRWKNNRVENSDQPTRQGERKMQRFKSSALSAKISLRSRCRLQYLQRHFRFNASHFPGRGDGSCLGAETILAL